MQQLSSLHFIEARELNMPPSQPKKGKKNRETQDRLKMHKPLKPFCKGINIYICLKKWKGIYSPLPAQAL